MEHLLPRRALLARGAAIVGGIASALVARRVGAAGPRFLPAYRLAPSLTASGRAGCATCRACQAHAANKLYASVAAADAHRAHPGCKCQVIAAPLPVDTWVALFGPPDNPARIHVDQRRPEIQRLLQPASVPALSFLGVPGRIGR